MIELTWPFVLLLLPAPIIVRWLLEPAQPACGAAIRVPFYQSFNGLHSRKSFAWMQSTHWHIWFSYIIWLLFLLALSLPKWINDPIHFPTSGRDLMLAVDISGSMETEDFTVDDKVISRLDAIKRVAGQFIEQRKGDRIGLILFGSKAYLQTPLTFDTDTIQQFLSTAEIGWAGQDTAIGDAIGIALKRLQPKPEQHKVLILLTDGTNTAGIADPFQAAEYAAKQGMKIYTIGVGSERVKLSLRLKDEPNLDEHSLEVIARVTGGQYFKAHDTEELQRIYQQLQTIEPTIGQDQYRKMSQHLYPWPLGIAFILSLILTKLLVGNFATRQIQ